MALRTVVGVILRSGTNRAAKQQAGPGADAGALTSANRRTGNGAYGRADNGAAHGRIVGHRADLLRRVVTTITVVEAECVETLTAAGMTLV